MSELAEEVVTEWLNRKGFFIIRGRREGNTELDVLAVKWAPAGPECWHYEVSVSSNPISYISKYGPEDRRRLGISAHNARRRDDCELARLVREWVKKKFHSPVTERVRQDLCATTWQLGFVHGKVKYQEELRMIQECGIKVVAFSTLVHEMLSVERTKRQEAAGGRIVELLGLRLNEVEVHA